MVKQMAGLKDSMDKLTQADRERMLLIRGIFIGLGITTLFSGGTLVAVVSAMGQVVQVLSAMPTAP